MGVRDPLRVLPLLLAVLAGVPSARAADQDADGLLDGVDNCRAVPNGAGNRSNQLDVDADGYGNACDADYDNNGSVDRNDLLSFRAAFGARSGDPGFLAAADADGDGVVGALDLRLLRASFGSAPGPSGWPCAGTIPCPDPRPSMLVIFLDDVARDGFPGLDRFSREGVRFTNAFTTVPVCGPSRANFLSGRFASSRVNGDLRDFDESDTIGTRMRAAGYVTALMGRYVNGYTRAHGVPPGWDRWLVHDGIPHYFDYRMVDEDREQVTSPHYSEDFLLGELVQWLAAQQGVPAFAVWMPYTSHADTSEGLMAVPAPRHQGALDATYAPWRPPNYNLKPPGLPQWVQDLPSANSDLHRQAALESTLAIEEAITWLQALFPELIIFVSSDNGMAWGEHGMHQSKACPHLQCLAIPMAVLGGPWSPRVIDELVVNEDIAATVLDLAGADTSDLDGVPLEPLLEGAAPPWRTLIPTFYGGTILGDTIPAWDGFYDIGTGEIGASYASGERERYDLDADPWMLDNLLFPLTRFAERRRLPGGLTLLPGGR